jgi:PEP-CTERM motif
MIVSISRIAAATALAAVLVAPAHAVLTTSPADISPLGGGVDFEAWDGFVTTGPESLNADVIFTGDTGSTLGAFIADLGGNGIWGAGNKFAATDIVGELRFTFAGGSFVQKAGAFVNHYELPALPLAVVVSVYGENNLIIETHTVTIDTADSSYNEGLFVGIVRPSADIRSISFKGVGVVVDNLAYTAPVPEPGAFAMLLAGLGAVGFMARRRGRGA